MVTSIRATLLLFMWVFLSQTAAAEGGRMVTYAMAAKLNFASCTQFTVLAPCFCPPSPIPCGLWIFSYEPAAYMETVGRPGGILLVVPTAALAVQALAKEGAASIGAYTSSSAQVDTTITSEAHVWSMPRNLWKIPSAGLACVMPKRTPSKHVGTDSAAVAKVKSLCTGSAASVNTFNASSSSANNSDSAIPSLYYASELDALNWRTGCRDASIIKTLKNGPVACAARAVAGEMNPLSSVSSGIKDLTGDGCVGYWGSLYPRQMMSVGNAIRIASALTSYRALSLARTAMETMPYPVNVHGRMQQVYPKESLCFNPGQHGPLKAYGAGTSKDGKYGWVYWAPFVGCVKWSQMASCHS